MSHFIINPKKVINFVQNQLPPTTGETELPLNEQEKIVAEKIIDLLLDSQETTLEVEENEGLDFLSDEEINEDDSQSDTEFKEEPTSSHGSGTQITADYAKKVLDWCKKNKNSSPQKRYPKLSTIQNNFRLIKDRNYIRRCQMYVDKKGTNQEKFQHISEFVLNKFRTSRAAGFQIHDRDLRLWALHKAHEIGLSINSFRASKTWILNFKKKNVVSRKMTKFVTVHSNKKIEEVIEEAVNFQDRFNSKIRPSFFDYEVFNIDQSGISYELYTGRTLSLCGEKKHRSYHEEHEFADSFVYHCSNAFNVWGTHVSTVFMSTGNRRQIWSDSTGFFKTSTKCFCHLYKIRETRQE